MSYFDWDPRSEIGAMMVVALIVGLAAALILIGMMVG